MFNSEHNLIRLSISASAFYNVTNLTVLSSYFLGTFSVECNTKGVLFLTAPVLQKVQKRSVVKPYVILLLSRKENTLNFLLVVNPKKVALKNSKVSNVKMAGLKSRDNHSVALKLFQDKQLGYGFGTSYESTKFQFFF